MNTEELCELYRQCVTDVGFHINEDDNLIKTAFDTSVGTLVKLPEISLLKVNDKKSRTTIDKKVVLPTKSHLKAPPGDYIIFHPISELLDRGESPTMLYLKDQMICTLMDKFCLLAINLGTIFANTDESFTYTPKQIMGLSSNKGFNKPALKTLKALLSKVMYGNIKRRPITIGARSKSEYRGETCRRVATLSSGLYLDLKNTPKGSKVWGVEVNESHRKAIIALFDYIFPGINDGEFSYASNNGVAPVFDSLTRCFMLVNQRMDGLVKIYSSIFKVGWQYPTAEYEWLELLNKLGSAKKALTTQDGNVGGSIAKPKSEQHVNSLKVREVSNVSTEEPTSHTATNDVPWEESPSKEVLDVDGVEREVGGKYKPATPVMATQDPRYNPAMTQPQYQMPPQPQPNVVMIGNVPHMQDNYGRWVPVQDGRYSTQPQQNQYSHYGYNQYQQPNGIDR